MYYICILYDVNVIFREPLRCSMKLLRSIVLVTALAVFGLAFAPALSFSGEPVLRVAVSGPYPPFAQLDKEGRLYGFDVDMAEAICRELQKKCEVVNVDFDLIIPGILKGEIDFAVAGMGASPERKQHVDFTDRYYRSVSIFIERRGTFKEINRESLKGKRVGAQVSTLQAEYLGKNLGDAITLVTAPSYDEIFAMLKNKEIDLVLSDGLPGYAYMTSAQGEGLETIGEPVEPGGSMDRACVAVSKKQPALRDAISQAILELRRTGQYDKINRKYFDFIVY